MNPRQMKQMMKRAGIKMEELDDVQEVIIRTKSKDYRVTQAQVQVVDMHGQKSYQIAGVTEELAKGAAGEAGAEAPSGPAIPAEDIALVAERTGASEAEARKALEECNGEVAEAIIKLMG